MSYRLGICLMCRTYPVTRTHKIPLYFLKYRMCQRARRESFLVLKMSQCVTVRSPAGKALRFCVRAWVELLRALGDRSET